MLDQPRPSVTTALRLYGVNCVTGASHASGMVTNRTFACNYNYKLSPCVKIDR